MLIDPPPLACPEATCVTGMSALPGAALSHAKPMRTHRTAQKAAAPSRAPIVGALGGEPERKLGVQKPPCVYKPVMSAEDLENCR